MALFTRSSCEDSVDRFNHTWLVIFLLLLAAVTFFIPFGLPPSGREAPRGTPEGPPKYISYCWCPAQFTDSAIEYTNAACTAAFTNAHSTGSYTDNNNNQNPASVFRVSNGIGMVPLERYTPERVAELNVNETYIVEHTEADTYEFVLEYTPLFLLVSAVMFKSAHTLFVLFVSWYGVSLSSLTETWRSLLEEPERGEQYRQTFLLAVSSKLKSSRLLSFGYLTYKLAICTLCIVVGLIIYFNMMPGLFSLDQRFHSGNMSAVQQSQPESVTLLCELPVREKQKTHIFIVQCLFTAAPNTATVRSDKDGYSRMVNFYKPFYTALLFTFVIVTLINALNWALLAVKLCRGQRSKRPNQILSLDARFLVSLTAEHVNFTASEKLEEGLTRVQKGSDPSDEFINVTQDL